MKNIFSKTIANLRESGNLKVTRQTFSNQIVFDQSIQCGQFTSIKFLNSDFKNIDFILMCLENTTKKQENFL